MGSATHPWQGPSEELAIAANADVYLFSAGITRENAQYLREHIEARPLRRDNAVLLLTTNGGDPDAAFLIARALKASYKKFSVLVTSLCKSAGTLIVIGADEIIMSDCAELGPLDIQLGKDDEIFKRSSGLDVSEAIRFLRELSWEVFEKNFMKLKAGTSITTKTAAEIAQGIARGIVEPIASQIDPIKLGEVNRSLVIAREYGKLLNPQFENFEKLISGYPSHGFVIDRMQAKNLFKNVRDATKTERKFEKSLGHLARDVVDLVYAFEPIISSTPETNEQADATPAEGTSQSAENSSNEEQRASSEPDGTAESTDRSN